MLCSAFFVGFGEWSGAYFKKKTENFFHGHFKGKSLKVWRHIPLLCAVGERYASMNMSTKYTARQTTYFKYKGIKMEVPILILVCIGDTQINLWRQLKNLIKTIIFQMKVVGIWPEIKQILVIWPWRNWYTEMDRIWLEMGRKWSIYISSLGFIDCCRLTTSNVSDILDSILSQLYPWRTSLAAFSECSINKPSNVRT